MEIDGPDRMTYGSAFQMVGQHNRKPEFQCSCATDAPRDVGCRQMILASVVLILDRRYAVSSDSSSLYVIVTVLYSIRHLTDIQWSSFSVLDMLMRPRWRVNTRASVFWIRFETFQVLSADIHQSRIGIVESASYE